MFYYTISYRRESEIMDLETWFQKITIFTEQNKVLSSDPSDCIESWMLACLSMTNFIMEETRESQRLFGPQPS